MPISLCMIVKDEAGFIGRAIASVKPIVSQVVVVDTGSSDDTVEIAKGLGAEVYRFGWADDFSAARNESLRHATGDWIMVLDADETVSKDDLGRIRELTVNSEYDGYALVQRNYTNDAYREGFLWAARDGYVESRGFAGWVPRLIVRLFRNKPGIRFEGNVHELVEGSITGSGGKYAAANLPIHHYGEIKPDDFRKAKHENYRRMLNEKVEGCPGNAQAWVEMGTIEREDKEFARALECFEKAVKLDGGLAEAWQGIGVCCSSLGETGKAIEAFKRAISLNPENPVPYFSLGVAYSRIGMFNDARDAIEEGLKRNPDDFNALANLGAIYEQGGHPEEAAKILQKVVSIDTGNARAWYNLAVSLDKVGKNEEAAAAYEKAAGLDYARKEDALKRARLLRGA